jgi:hypothetical protein
VCECIKFIFETQVREMLLRFVDSALLQLLGVGWAGHVDSSRESLRGVFFSLQKLFEKVLGGLWSVSHIVSGRSSIDCRLLADSDVEERDSRARLLVRLPACLSAYTEK